jgi:hypothetical protein
MEQLIANQARIVKDVNLKFQRYLMKEIDWDNRLIAITEQRGVGKTTLLLQKIKMSTEAEK